MKRVLLALILAVCAAACSQSELYPAAPSGIATGANVLASVADTVIGDARNSCNSDVPTGLVANANNGKVDVANHTVANVRRYVYRFEVRDSVTDEWRPARATDYTHDGKPLFTIYGLPSGHSRVSVRTPCMPAGVWSKPFDFSV